MYHIVAEAKVQDAQRAARAQHAAHDWTEACAGRVIQPHNAAHPIVKTFRRFAAAALSFLA